MEKLENVLYLDGIPNMVEVEEEDAKKLTTTIIEVDASKELFEMAKADGDAKTMKILFDFYMTALKEHKLLWGELLNQYVGEDHASYYFNLYRFDRHRKVIFLMKQEGCSLCS